MFEDILEYIVGKGVYTEIKGVTTAGTEKIIKKGAYVQQDKEHAIFYQELSTGEHAVFSTNSVDTILFHERGCTITLKR